MVSRDVGSLEAQIGLTRRGIDRLRSFRDIAKGFSTRKPLGAAGAVLVLILVFIAIFAPLLAPQDPYHVDPVENRYAPPGGELILGGDEVGRDVLSRIIYGTRLSLHVGIFSVTLGIAIGAFLGISSAYVGGKFDLIIQRIVDTLMAFPGLILALAIMAVLGSGVYNVIVALIVVFVPGVTRIVRSQALSIKEMDYVTAARALGCGASRIMLRHILPNTFASLIVLSTITLGWAIIVEASLSFLGAGVPADIPSWGGMLSYSAQRYIKVAPWLIIAPGVAIGVTVFSVNMLGDALRDVLDPRLRGTGTSA
jgi:peptide/nickel transport system permease protein